LFWWYFFGTCFCRSSIKYEFDFFEVISSGKRHPGISGTEMRKYALMNDLRSFYFRAPNGGADAISEMYHETKRELKRLTK
jgi:hypothetical protein